MEKINTVLFKSTNYLKKNNITSAALDSELLLSSIINKSREEMIIDSEDKIDEINIKKFKNLIERRKNREPVAYILNKKDFWTSTFYVNKDVLIPRPDTEILIQEVLSYFPEKKSILVLDIGTGSGCIILSLLKDRKKFKGIAIDKSKKALKVAEINAKIHQLENRVKFIKTSVDNFFKGKYDLIISNPPYITNYKIKYLDKDICYEPLVSLNGGPSGSLVLNKVIKKSSSLIKIGGKLILEIGYDQRLEIMKLLRNNGFYLNKIIKDYAKNDRCIIATKI